MRNFKMALLGLALSSSMSMADDCVAPAVPEVPDGASSTMEQMLAGQKAVKTFQAANLEYMACLEPKLAAAEADAVEGSEEAVQTYQKIQEDYNAAVSREEDVAGKFNTAIREYKAANPS